MTEEGGCMAGAGVGLEFLGESSAGRLSEIARPIWMECYPGMIGREATELIFEDWQSEEAIRRQIREGYLYSFVMSDGEVAGYVCVRPEGRDLCISKVYVDAAHRGTGLGSRAISSLIEYGRGIGSERAYLHVNKKNAQAIRAYEANGMEIVSSRTVPFRDGIVIDDYVMEYRYV
ncbi:MAG: GNAT family N-acetyltransferase [Candidatus Methanoplasma sp.]|jgi:ribosomal protein S18 acetylase RimI-like enzyme|nr:GNAT family N-acetyltransferase [Candidatus Methanoplasma sp.]